MGCSAPDIIKKGSGAALLNDTERVKRILQSCKKAVKTRLSVKMRTGFESSDKEKLIDFVKMLKDEGVDFITVHPRHAKISFKRKADWKLIRVINDNVEIPLIGNGDITDPHTGISRMQRYGCHGIMIGREAVKSPWIFSLCRRILNGEESIKMKVNLQEIFTDTLLFMEKYLPKNLQKSRSLRFCYYFSGNVKFAHQLFTRIRQKEKIDDIIEIINGYFTRNPHEIFKEIYFENRINNNNW
jgi:tRNA-dihydrouridine synthase